VCPFLTPFPFVHSHSLSHTNPNATLRQEDLIKAVEVIDEVTDLLCLKYNRSFLG